MGWLLLWGYYGLLWVKLGLTRGLWVCRFRYDLALVSFVAEAIWVAMGEFGV